MSTSKPFFSQVPLLQATGVGTEVALHPSPSQHPLAIANTKIRIVVSLTLGICTRQANVETRMESGRSGRSIGTLQLPLGSVSVWDLEQLAQSLSNLNALGQPLV